MAMRSGGPLVNQVQFAENIKLQGRTKEEVSSLLENPADYNLQKGNGYCPTGHVLTTADEVNFVLDHVEETGAKQLG